LPVKRSAFFSRPEKNTRAEMALAVLCRLLPPFADARFMFMDVEFVKTDENAGQELCHEGSMQEGFARFGSGTETIDLYFP